MTSNSDSTSNFGSRAMDAKLFLGLQFFDDFCGTKGGREIGSRVRHFLDKNETFRTPPETPKEDRTNTRPNDN